MTLANRSRLHVPRSASLRGEPPLMPGTSVLADIVLANHFEIEPGRIGRSNSPVLMLIFRLFLYIKGLDILLSRHEDGLMAHIDSSLIKPQSVGDQSRNSAARHGTRQAE